MDQVLVIDDDGAFRDGLIETLGDLGYRGHGVAGVRAALAWLEANSPRAVFVDYRMPGIDGLEGIRLIREKTRQAPLPIVMLTAYVDSENTITAMKLGAFDHLTKPIGRADVEKTMRAIEKAYPRDAAPAPASPAGARGSASSLVGTSAAMRETLKLIGKVSASDSTVLITGETGTGKELVARSIHANGDRARGPFVAVNCAAIPETLLESELFGHVKGAFTGAVADRKGAIRQADGGVLFLDEVGDMNLALQAKLLRILQEREIVPVGGSSPVPVDVRVLAATHQDLRAMVARKEFREDLYYRLAVVEVHLPPLRERAEDVPALAQHFLPAAGDGGAPRSLAPDALEKFRRHAWPGNVRELKNTVERASVIAAGPVIRADDVRFLSAGAGNGTAPGTDATTMPEDLDLPSSVARLEKNLIERALAAANGNRTEAARKLGIQRQLLYTKMKDYLIGRE